MTNIKARGFDSPAQLREHLEDLDDEPVARASDEAGSPGGAMARQRREVAALQQRLSKLRLEAARLEMPEASSRLPLLRLVSTAAATFLLARIVENVRDRRPR